MLHQMAMNDSLENTATHYQVLGLPFHVGPGSDVSTQHLKAAYRRALLQHHPDKNSEDKFRYTIDRIFEAYATLSIPKLRSEYDRALKLRAQPLKAIADDQTFHSGLEVFDLDDLSYDEIEEVWFKGCRCGDERGFQIREVDLEETSDMGELHVGCKGCSIWLKVLFAIVGEKLEDRVMDSG